MKRRKMRIWSLLLATIMAVCCVSTTTYAAEETEPVGVYTFEIDAENEGIMLLDVDQTFTVNGSHRGADRTFYTNYLRYTITATDVNGNPTDKKVVVSVNDYNHAAPIQSSTIYADGTTYGYDVPITYGKPVYLTYVVNGGGSVRLHVILEGHN